MTIKRYLELLHTTYGVQIRLSKDRKRLAGFAGQLPATALAMLAGYKPQILAALRRRGGLSSALDLSAAHINLAALGFLPLDTGPLCHPDGDEVGEGILVGVLNAKPASTPRERYIAQGPGLPPIENPVLTPVPGKPGTYRYTIRRGQRIAKLPTERN